MRRRYLKVEDIGRVGLKAESNKPGHLSVPIIPSVGARPCGGASLAVREPVPLGIFAFVPNKSERRLFSRPVCA